MEYHITHSSSDLFRFQNGILNKVAVCKRISCVHDESKVMTVFHTDLLIFGLCDTCTFCRRDGVTAQQLFFFGG